MSNEFNPTDYEIKSKVKPQPIVSPSIQPPIVEKEPKENIVKKIIKQKPQIQIEQSSQPIIIREVLTVPQFILDTAFLLAFIMVIIFFIKYFVVGHF